MLSFEELEKLLVCPETKEKLTFVPANALDTFMEIEKVQNLQNQHTDRVLDGVFLREDKAVAYAVWDHIPNMLIPDRIALK